MWYTNFIGRITREQFLTSFLTKGVNVMKKVIILVGTCILVLIPSQTQASLVELNLLSLGCPQEFPGSWNSWESDFDLGVTFSDIFHVHIDWAGEITGGLFQQTDPFTFEPIGDPIQVNEGIFISLGYNPHKRRVIQWGGALTYPYPEPFDSLLEIELPTATTWSDLLDGQGDVEIGYYDVIPLNGHYIKHGEIFLDEATLIIEGTVIPEPATFLLLTIGLVGIFSKNKRIKS